MPDLKGTKRENTSLHSSQLQSIYFVVLFQRRVPVTAVHDTLRCTFGALAGVTEEDVSTFTPVVFAPLTREGFTLYEEKDFPI